VGRARVSGQARSRPSSGRPDAPTEKQSGTPVLSTLNEGLAGDWPTAVRGVLNATANFILSEMGRGKRYADALTEAQQRGLAEGDPSADLDGHDSVAKDDPRGARVRPTVPRRRGESSRDLLD
jgi:Homoserine dehydrogenase